MKKTVITFVVLVIILVGLQKYKEPELGEYKIVVLAPLSDVFADYGEEIKEGVLAGTDQGVEIVFEDTQCDPAKTLSVYRKAVDIDNTKFIIGPACGSPQEIVASELEKDKVVAISPSAATEDLYEKSGRYNFGVQYSLEQESRFIAEQMTQFGHKRVVLISYQNAFSETHVKSFKENFTGEIVEHIVFLEAGSDVSTEVAKLKEQNFDAIYSVDTSFFFGQGVEKLRQLEFNQPVFSMYAMELPAIRPLVEGVIYSFPAGMGERGATYENARLAGEYLSKMVVHCEAKVWCVRRNLDVKGGFKEGVRKQEIILKQIVDGEAVVFEG